VKKTTVQVRSAIGRTECSVRSRTQFPHHHSTTETIIGPCLDGLVVRSFTLSLFRIATRPSSPRRAASSLPRETLTLGMDNTKYGNAVEFDIDLHSIYAAYL
jgi:hypothetical protein